MTTYYFVGSEDCDFATVGTVAVTTTAGRYRSSYVRHALSVSYVGGTTTTGDGLFATFTSAVSDFWVGAQAYLHPSGTGTTTGVVMGFRDGSTTRLRLIPDGTNNAANGKWRLVKYNSVGTATILATAAGAWTTASLFKFDVHVNYAVAGSFNLYVNGVNVFSYSGDLTTDGATTISGIQCGPAAASTGGGSEWSEVVVSDSDTRNVGLATLIPLAAGNTQAWSGSVSDINEATLSDATLISTAVANDLAQFTVTPASIITGSLSIRGVSVNARAAKGGSGPQNLQASVRTGSTDYASSNLSVAGSLSQVFNVWQTNPNTGVAWTVADLTAVGFNVGLKAIT